MRQIAAKGEYFIFNSEVGEKKVTIVISGGVEIGKVQSVTSKVRWHADGKANLW